MTIKKQIILETLLTLLKTGGFEELKPSAGGRRVLRVSRTIRNEIIVAHRIKLSIRDIAKEIGSLEGVSHRYISVDGAKYRATIITEHAVKLIDKRLKLC